MRDRRGSSRTPLPYSLLVVDSPSLEDRTPVARWGYTLKGPFQDFKFHVTVNYEGLS
ncbi:MAG: hypothetical protein V3V81_00455 [Candidatus Bathyarchaeia archaeon]